MMGALAHKRRLGHTQLYLEVQRTRTVLLGARRRYWAAPRSLRARAMLVMRVRMVVLAPNVLLEHTRARLEQQAARLVGQTPMVQRDPLH